MVLSKYCSKWKNNDRYLENKSHMWSFERGIFKNVYSRKIYDDKIEIVNTFNYLGTVLSACGGSFVYATNNLAD